MWRGEKISLVGVHAKIVYDSSGWVANGAPTFSTLTGPFLRQQLGLEQLFSDELDEDCDGIADQVDNCPGVKNPGQQDTNGNFVGDACDFCPWQQPYDPTNSNARAESAMDKPVLPDACDPVPHERPDPIMPAGELLKDTLVQGDGWGPDDVVEIRSSTFVGRLTEATPVTKLGDGTSTFRWCNCVSNGEARPFDTCVNKYTSSRCPTINPTSHEDKWRELTLDPSTPDSNFPREFWVGKSASHSTWSWSWYADFTSANEELRTDPDSLQPLSYASAALLAHVDDPDALDPERNDLRDVYRQVVTGPIWRKSLPQIQPPLSSCLGPQCKLWFGPMHECTVCVGPALSLESFVDPFFVVPHHNRIFAMSAEGWSTDITDLISAASAQALHEDRIWLRPSEPGGALSLLQAPYESVSVKRLFEAGESPLAIVAPTDQMRQQCHRATSGSCEMVRLAGQTLPRAHAQSSMETGNELPPLLWEPKIALSGLQGSMFMLGAPSTDGTVDRLWRYDLAPRRWTQLWLTGQLVPSSAATSLAYDAYAGQVYFLDEATRPKRAVLGVIDVRTGTVEQLGAWPRPGVFDDVYVQLAADRAIVLIGAAPKKYAAFRFVRAGSGVVLDGALTGRGEVLDRAFMGKSELVLPLRSGQTGMLLPLAPEAFDRRSPHKVEL